MNLNILGILIVFGVVLFSMTLHEMAHAYVAYWLGDSTAKDEGRLSPNPFVHIDPIMSLVVPIVLYVTTGTVFGGAKPVPINTRNLKGGAWGMALVGIAGPLMNFILAFIGFLIGHFTGLIYGNDLWAVFFSELVLANLGFCVFNMIPIPPLDGSRVLYAIAPDGIRDFMERMERTMGIFIVMILVVFFGGYLSSFTSTVIYNLLMSFRWIVGWGV